MIYDMMIIGELLDMLKKMTEEASGWMDDDWGVSENEVILEARALIKRYDPNWKSQFEEDYAKRN